MYSRLLSADLLTLRRDEVLPDGGRGAAAAAVSDGAVGAVELITAADVLVYFGELRSLLQAFASLLMSGCYAALRAHTRETTVGVVVSGWLKGGADSAFAAWGTCLHIARCCSPRTLGGPCPWWAGECRR